MISNIAMFFCALMALVSYFFYMRDEIEEIRRLDYIRWKARDIARRKEFQKKLLSQVFKSMIKSSEYQPPISKHLIINTEPFWITPDARHLDPYKTKENETIPEVQHGK